MKQLGHQSTRELSLPHTVPFPRGLLGAELVGTDSQPALRLQFSLLSLLSQPPGDPSLKQPPALGYLELLTFPCSAAGDPWLPLGLECFSSCYKVERPGTHGRRLKGHPSM